MSSKPTNGGALLEGMALSAARGLLSLCEAPCVLLDADGRIAACNGAVSELFERDEDTLLGREAWEFSDDLAPGYFGVTSQTGDATSWGSMRSGQVIQNRLVPIRGDASAFGGAIWLMTRDTQDGLDEREVLAEHVRHAQKLESVNRLAGGIAHDFNNVLTAIIVEAELLGMQLPEDMDHTAIDEIVGAVRRGAALTSRLLTFVRKRRNDDKSVNLDEAVHNVANLLRRLVEKNIELEVWLKSAVRVWIDPTSLDQIIVNLVTNARDAMPNGGRITIQTRVEGEGEFEMAVIVVSDTGSGIPEELLSLVYEPFFTTKGENEGTGLGLSTVRDIVSEHNGSARIQSGSDGTTVTIRLPVHGSSETIAGPALGAASRPRRRGKVLVVDSDEAVRTVVCRVLASAGYQVFDAADLAGAVERHAECGAVDLLLSDAIIRGGGGVDLVGMLREQQPDLRALLTISYLSDHRGADQLGEPSLAKPFSTQQLLACIDEVMGDGAEPPPVEN